MLPVKFALPGKNGINPIMFEIQMKKNTVNKYGVYLSACLPRFGSITSSLMNKITGSNHAWKPFGACPGRRLYARAQPMNITNMMIATRNNVNTFFVIEKSSGPLSVTSPFST